MAVSDLIIDLGTIDLEATFADTDEIRQYNPQRHEMEQLTAIVYVDPEQHICVGYKQTSLDDFWVRGHMPGMPLMPGVIMCEAAAQLSSFYTQRYDLLGAEMVGFGGLEDVRFRESVFPGDRLYVVCKLTRVRRGRMIVCQFQGFVRERMAVEGTIKGIPLSQDSVASLKQGPVDQTDGTPRTS